MGQVLAVVGPVDALQKLGQRDRRREDEVAVRPDELLVLLGQLGQRVLQPTRDRGGDSRRCFTGFLDKLKIDKLHISRNLNFPRIQKCKFPQFHVLKRLLELRCIR